ncbi:DUF1634 domain-containing protein [Paenibacillus sp. sgz500958]|uniref:DUF1634 domain-containing protein n=1 Tax=Paenibacillus sp. sgz500958 TaxID=3242475 RepID=UPI0036D22D1C
MEGVKETAVSRIGEVELIVSKVLRIGVLISASVILLGLLKLLVTGVGGYPEGTYPVTLGGMLQGVADFKAVAIMQSGLFLLILTPVLRVASSLVVFLKEKDYLYVGITLIVFCILIISFLLGKAA